MVPVADTKLPWGAVNDLTIGVLLPSRKPERLTLYDVPDGGTTV